MKINFGFDFKQIKDGLFFDFKEEIPNWKRYASELIRDKVILDLKNAKKMVEAQGDFIVYEVYNLWKSIDFFKKIYEKTRIVSDITLLNHGIFSTSSKGELFLTYGHAHKANCGEVYNILKNRCFLILSEKNNFETFILKLKEGDSVFIHPKFLHRVVAYKKDCLLISFVPEKAGHDYLAIKGKGFPFHLFYDKKKRKIEVKKNPKYRAKYKVIERAKKCSNPLNLVRRNPEKLKDILENPEKYESIYSLS